MVAQGLLGGAGLESGRLEKSAFGDGSFGEWEANYFPTDARLALIPVVQTLPDKNSGGNRRVELRDLLLIYIERYDSSTKVLDAVVVTDPGRPWIIIIVGP